MSRKNDLIQVQIQRRGGDRIKKTFFLLALGVSALAASAQDRRTLWTDSVFQTLSVREKIGQLFMIPVSGYLTTNEEASLATKLKTYSVGSIHITQGGPQRVSSLLNRLQRMARVPLLVGIDATAGLSPTLDSVVNFPRPMELGSIRYDSMVYSLATTIGVQMKMTGLHLNLAAWVGTYRRELNYLDYFGDRQKLRVIELLRGMHDQGIVTCAGGVAPQKRPGYKDSIAILDLGRLDTAVFANYLTLIRGGIGGIVSSDFNLSVTENGKPVPAGVSSVFLNEVLRKRFGFNGLMLANLPKVRNVTGKKGKGETELLAFAAGNDLLIAPENLEDAVTRILKEVTRNPVRMMQLEASVKRVLGAKYDAGLARYADANCDNIVRRLTSPDDRLLAEQLIENTVAVARNSSTAIPIPVLEGKKFVSVTVGGKMQNEFNHYLGKYAEIKKLVVSSGADTAGLKAGVASADVVIFGIFPGAAAFHSDLVATIRKIAQQRQIIICYFGNPDGLRFYVALPTVVVAITDGEGVQRTAAQLIFGGLTSKGILPVTINAAFQAGQGVSTTSGDRLSYTLPEAAGMDSRTLDQIERIASEAIAMKATPGCQVMVVKDRKVVYQRSFGSLTYDHPAPVTDTTLFDLASVTKVSATLQAVMYMYEHGLIDINKKASVYLPELRTSNKKDFTIKDILTHQAGLWPFLPFWTDTMKDSTLLPQYYSTTASAEYPFPVSSNLFATKSMKDSLWHWIIKARVREKTRRTPYDYRYSDMGFYILQHLAERILHEPLEDFVSKHLYEPLGAYTTGYLPLRKFPPAQIAPTENDRSFRKTLLIGYVHDQGAAMHGGIAGHAGLFSTANDLAKLGQMWLQNGSYGHRQYFKPETLEVFTQKQYENSRRGLGWDKPALSDPNGPTSLFASPKTFGHTGFTGISIWIDPEFNLVFIFFSNRVNPDMTNNKILNANIRPRIQDVVYKSIFRYCENHN